jgi:hypothetical protein
MGKVGPPLGIRGNGEWGIPIVVILPPLPPLLFPYSPLPTPLTTTDIERVNLCEF